MSAGGFRKAPPRSRRMFGGVYKPGPELAVRMLQEKGLFSESEGTELIAATIEHVDRMTAGRAGNPAFLALLEHAFINGARWLREQERSRAIDVTGGAR